MNQWQRYTIVVILLVTTAVVYWQVRTHEFLLYDDDRYITANPQVRSGLTIESIGWAFTTGYASNWHPLTWLSHMIDVSRFGLNPAGHLLTNVFLHLLNTFLLWYVLHRMTRTFWPSIIVAAVFALHPLHVESVAWVSERKDVLSGLFWMLTLLAYVRYVEEPRGRRIALVVLMLALGLLAKPMLVTLPFVLLLMDVWPLQRLGYPRTRPAEDAADAHDHPDHVFSRIWSLVREKLPLIVLAALSSIITYVAQQQGGAMSTVEAIPLPVRVENAINASVGYVIKSVWPHNLAVFYPHRGEQIPTWQTLASLAALALMTVAAIRVLRRAPYIAVGWFWFLGTLVPVLGLVQVGAQAMADRYMYLPQIGLCMIVAWGFRELWVGWKYRFVLLGSIGLTVCIAFAWLSYEQIGYWKNTVTLFEHTLKVSEKNWVAHHNLGTAYLRANEYRRAADQFARTLEIYPMIASTHNNLGKALIALGRPDSARIHFQDAIRHDPRLTDAYVNLGMLELENGNWSEAIRFFREAVGINPRDANAHFNLAITLSKIGQAAEALSHLATVLEIDPRDEEARREYDRVRAGQFK